MNFKEKKIEYLESEEWLQFKNPSKVDSLNSKEQYVLNFRIQNIYIKAINAEVERGKYMNKSEFLRAVVRNYFLPPLK